MQKYNKHGSNCDTSQRIILYFDYFFVIVEILNKPLFLFRVQPIFTDMVSTYTI